MNYKKIVKNQVFDKDLFEQSSWFVEGNQTEAIKEMLTCTGCGNLVTNC